jgi:hypothetical protein
MNDHTQASEPGVSRPPARDRDTANAFLADLEAELRRHGWTTELTPASKVPTLLVRNPAAGMLHEHVLAAPARGGTWWLWWPWADRIAPAGDVTAAAGRIMHVLRVRDPGQ